MSTTEEGREFTTSCKVQIFGGNNKNLAPKYTP